MQGPAHGMTRFDSQEVAKLLKKARRVVTHPGLHILIAPAAQPLGRVLVITSRKVGNAPQRNKIRRRIKAIFYEHELTERGFDCIVIVKKGGIELTFEQLQGMLLSAIPVERSNGSTELTTNGLKTILK